MKVAIVTSGYMPVPAATGGAVETLIDSLVAKNEEYGQLHLVIFSIYHPQAVEWSRGKKHTDYIFIKTPLLCRWIDRSIYGVAKMALGSRKSKSYRYIAQRLHYLSKVGNYLAKKDYDKVILENHPTLFMLLKKHHNMEKYIGKYYYHLHNEVTSSYGCKRQIIHCEKVLGVSRYIDQTLKQSVFELPEQKLDVLKNGIDLSRFSDPANQHAANYLRQTYGILPSEKVILFTGRLSPEKGIKELLLAFHRLHFPNVKLVVAGGYFYGSHMSGRYERTLKEIAESMKERIIFTGFIPYRQMPAVYAMADFAVIPSLWDDPAPLTVIESMASGLPLITTQSGGIPEYVSDKCAIVLPRDGKLIDRLINSMKQLLLDQQLRLAMSKAGRKQAEKFTSDNFYQHFIEEIS